MNLMKTSRVTAAACAIAVALYLSISSPTPSPETSASELLPSQRRRLRAFLPELIAPQTVHIKTTETETEQIFNGPNVAPPPPPPIVFTGLNYEMGKGASAKIIPFLCHKNERIVILTNTPQPAAESGELGHCVETVNIADTYKQSVSEMPYDTRLDGFVARQKVFYD